MFSSSRYRASAAGFGEERWVVVVVVLLVDLSEDVLFVVISLHHLFAVFVSRALFKKTES